MNKLVCRLEIENCKVLAATALAGRSSNDLLSSVISRALKRLTRTVLHVTPCIAIRTLMRSLSQLISPDLPTVVNHTHVARSTAQSMMQFISRLSHIVLFYDVLSNLTCLSEYYILCAVRIGSVKSNLLFPTVRRVISIES